MQKHFFFHSVFVLITLRETMRALRKSLNLSGQISFIDHQKKICMYLCFDFVMEILFKKKDSSAKFTYDEEIQYNSIQWTQ